MLFNIFLGNIWNCQLHSRRNRQTAAGFQPAGGHFKAARTAAVSREGPRRVEHRHPLHGTRAVGRGSEPAVAAGGQPKGRQRPGATQK